MACRQFARGGSLAPNSYFEETKMAR